MPLHQTFDYAFPAQIGSDQGHVAREECWLKI